MGIAEDAGQFYEPRSQTVPMRTVGVVVARMDLQGRVYGLEERLPCEEADALLKLRFLNDRKPELEGWFALPELRPLPRSEANFGTGPSV